jgi:S-formylglutathione hydrolase FrmB
MRGGGISRRAALLGGLGAVAAVAAAGGTAYELITHGVLPGKSELDRLDGACSVPATPFTFPAGVGDTVSGSFYSSKRSRQVAYSIGYPPAHRAGARLPLVVMLHGFGGDHATALTRLSPAQAVALPSDPSAGGGALTPMALVTVDGGNGYWNAHPGDDPMGMLVDELIPLCQRLGLGRPPHRIGAMGISMGGYGALLLTEKYPSLVSAVAAISPAIWTSYAQARAANAGAYDSAAAFAANDAITHAGSLAGLPVRVAAGYGDPFYPGVQALAAALPAGSVVDFGNGCHDGPFFSAREPASLRFLAGHLAGPAQSRSGAAG